MMKLNVKIWAREMYNQVTGSIAFYPAIIALIFLGLSVLSIAFDFSEGGKALKSQLHWLRLQDPSTARSIIGAIVSGIISLTVFSFSMVMIVLNQTASQMSNRILDNIIGSRFQQIVLGIYVGTIVYALFLLSTIREVDSGIYIPALSTYLLIGLTICDIFLFIYFLHYITQSVKYDVIIRRITKETLQSMELTCSTNKIKMDDDPVRDGSVILSLAPGIYEGYNKNTLISLCDKQDCIITILPQPGTFLLKGIPIAKINIDLTEETLMKFQNELYVHTPETIKGNYSYGFKQLTEVGLKALSPGVNDPGTAIQVMRALFDLYSYRSCHSPTGHVRSEKNIIRIIQNEPTFEETFEQTILPIWDYGKNDRTIQVEIHHLLTQLLALSSNLTVAVLLNEVAMMMKSKRAVPA